MSCEELHSKTIPELRKIATDMGIQNIPNLKADIIDTIYNASQSTPRRPVSPVPAAVSTNLNSLNVKQLKELAKERGIPGYYKLNRSQLLSALAASSRPVSPVRVVTPPKPVSPVVPAAVSTNLNSFNVKQLKELAKERGIPGYYKLNRSQLLSALAASSRPASPVRVVTPQRPASPVRVVTPPRPVSPVRVVTPPRPASPVRITTPDIIPQIEDRQKYIDDILRDIQVNDTDKYLRTVSAKILRCLGMY